MYFYFLSLSLGGDWKIICVYFRLERRQQQQNRSQQHSNGDDGPQQLATTKGVVGAKVSQLAHLFQTRSKEEITISTTTTTTTSNISSVVPLPVSPTTANNTNNTSSSNNVTGPRVKVSSNRTETDKDVHQDVTQF